MEAVRRLYTDLGEAAPSRSGRSLFHGFLLVASNARFPSNAHNHPLAFSALNEWPARRNPVVKACQQNGSEPPAARDPEVIEQANESDVRARRSLA